MAIEPPHRQPRPLRLRPRRARRHGRRLDRPVAPGHARHHPDLRRDGRRAHPARRRALRLPAPRLREGVRVAHLAQLHPVHGPAELLLAAHQRLRVLRRRRAADGHRDHAPGRGPAHAPVGVLAPVRPHHLHRGDPHGAGGDDRLPLPGDDPRLHVRAHRGAHRGAGHALVRAHRGPRARPAAGLARPPGGDPRPVRRLRGARARARGPEPHLHRPHARRGRPLAGRRALLRLHRADAALHGPRHRPAQGHALPRLPRARLRGPRRHQGRQLRPLLRAHARDGRVGAHDPPVRRHARGRARSTSTTAAAPSPRSPSSTARSSRSSTTSSW